MIVHPAVTVRGLPEARRVLAFGLPATLLSTRGAASSGGCLWWRAVIAAARRAWPETPCDDVLDCADAPGMAMSALRAGQRVLILEATSPAFDAVRGAGETVGAVVLGGRPAALELGARGAERRLEAWLRGGVTG
jgi:hypothetical protein